MLVSHSVFVTSIKETPVGGAIVEASNGSPEGPPFVRFELNTTEARKCRIGKRYILTLEEAKEN